MMKGLNVRQVDLPPEQQGDTFFALIGRVKKLTIACLTPRRAEQSSGELRELALKLRGLSLLALAALAGSGPDWELVRDHRPELLKIVEEFRTGDGETTFLAAYALAAEILVAASEGGKTIPKARSSRALYFMDKPRQITEMEIIAGYAEISEQEAE